MRIAIQNITLLLLAIPCVAALQVQDLKTEYTRNPLGIDVAKPQLSWILTSSDRGQVQRAYQVLASSTPQNVAADRGDLWDSGRVDSDRTVQIEYAGSPLKSAQQVFWKVRVWDGNNQPSAYSAAGSWTMGLLSESDWGGAKWIMAPPDLTAPTVLLRKSFEIKPGLSRAVAFVCGLGQYEMTLNGTSVCPDLLTPGWSKYDKTCLYDTYDVTTLLKSGPNAAGMLLGNGMYNVVGGRYTKFKGSFGPQKAIALLRLEYADGSVQQIGTDESWKASAGPITFSCVYGGEDWDARLEQRGFDSPGFDEAAWKSVAVGSGPGGVLRGLTYASPPIRVIESFIPKKLSETDPRTSIWDFGQNASMMMRLTVRGPAGSSVRIVPSELLRANGTLDPASTRNGPAYWQYTLRGDGAETWQSRFFYHGMRYGQVELIPATPDGPLPVVAKLEGLVTHSTSEPIGEFACSNELFNRIRTLIRWAQRSNMVSVLSDCPHRERLGWMEQAYLNGPSLRYEFDLASFFRKCMNDMADSQLADGLVPDIAPEYTVFTGGFRDSPEWGSAFIQCAWQQYEWTGDTSLLSRYYDGMKRYVNYLKSKSNDHIVSHGLGDWYDLGPNRPGRAQLTPLSVTATAIYYDDLRIMERTAGLLGKADDQREFAALAAEVRAAYLKTHFNPETGVFATGSQTANAMSIALGLCDPQDTPRVIDAIVKDIRDRGNALTAGDVGYTYLLKTLAAHGRSDVIHDMNNQSEKPGYGFQLAKGATALTEAWDARSNSSHNHFMLGHIMEWFYHDLAGIGGDPSGPGYKKIIIKPTPVGDITWARASLNSVRGTITSDWKRDGGTFTLKVQIPPNTTATITIPTSGPNSILEDGVPTSQRKDLRPLPGTPAAAVFEVPSGTYLFSAKQ